MGLSMNGMVMFLIKFVTADTPSINLLEVISPLQLSEVMVLCVLGVIQNLVDLHMVLLRICRMAF